tara:strand:+ start:81 stop:539 length:459 start_codon:yes stop_codon:yes gene_type:complete
MPRLDKDELKSIIKECLIELLSEGLAPKPTRTGRRSKRKVNEAFTRQSARSAEAAALRKRNSYLDSIKPGDQRRDKSQAVKSHMSKITSDPLMQDILSDTASTTLVNQGSAKASARQVPNVPADQAAQIVQEHDPTELFSESAKNWATLAFS